MPAIADLVAAATARIASLRQRAMRHRPLASLDERMLTDIGLRPSQVRYEVVSTFVRY